MKTMQSTWRSAIQRGIERSSETGSSHEKCDIGKAQIRFRVAQCVNISAAISLLCGAHCIVYRS